MKQLGLACHNYADVNAEYLPLNHASQRFGNNGQEVSWITNSLPYLDQGPLYDKLDFTYTATGDNYGTTGRNRPFYREVLTAVLCPSNPMPAKSSAYFRTESTGTDTLPRTDYCGNMGNGRTEFARQDSFSKGWVAGQAWHNPVQNLPADGANAGIFHYCRGTKLSQITDGTSNTVLVWESHPWNGRISAGGQFRGQLANASFQSAWSRVMSAVTPGVTAINDYTSASGNQNTRPSGPCSTHTGGTHALMCDGTVKFLNENMNRVTVQQRLSTRAGGDVVGEF
jgi:hypothetical protein